MGISPAAAGLLGGMSGGIAQAYATMGESTYCCWIPDELQCCVRHLKASACRYALSNLDILRDSILIRWRLLIHLLDRFHDLHEDG